MEIRDDVRTILALLEEMTKKTTIDPEDLTPEERRAVLERAAKETRRRVENEIITRQLEREAQEEERRRASS